MKNTTVSRRYAKALLLLAEEKNSIDQFEKDLLEIDNLIKNEEKLAALWQSVDFGSSDKKHFIKEIFQGKFAEEVIKFLMLIIDKNREKYLHHIVAAYCKEADVARNIEEAEVITAVQLTDKDFKGLQEKLSVVTGKNIRLRTSVDPSLVGGVIVKIGDQVIDGSVIKRLAILNNRLKGTQFNKMGVRD